MNSAQAQRLVESLRKGIPPDGFVRHFTVGREGEINNLLSRLEQRKKGALLIKANYGSGKTHLLRFVRESALERGFAVSFVTLDSKSAVRFNRMDQILGAIWRGLEIPGETGQKGVRPFFNYLHNQIQQARTDSNGSNGFWSQLSNNWKWDYSDHLDSPSMYIALRAWGADDGEAQDLIDDWFRQPWQYQARRTLLYQSLVGGLRTHFRDPRPEQQFYSFDAGIFNFRFQNYSQSWACIRDIQTLAFESGLKGLILIFDEFEDVVSNLKNIKYQEDAFWNLFEFYSGKQYPGMSFYAVTPDFAQKCKDLLLDKDRWDFDYSRFEKLPTFQMSPLDVEELTDLAMKILETHGIAYSWEPDLEMKSSELKSIVKKAASVQVQDRARHTITAVVKSLDRLFEDHEDN